MHSLSSMTNGRVYQVLQKNWKCECSSQPSRRSPIDTPACFLLLTSVQILKLCNWYDKQLSQSASVGSQSVTRYSSQPSNALTSSSKISKPPISAFALILSLSTDFGSGTYPFCRDHLTNNCAGVHLYFLLNSTTFGCLNRRARASGAYASTTMLFWVQNDAMSVRVLKGWTSIWLTAGGI